MKRQKIKRSVILLSVLVLLVSASACGNTSTDKTKTSTDKTGSTTVAAVSTATAPITPVTLKFLNDWNGSAAGGLLDSTNNAVGNVIKEKTGVTLDVEYATMAENEKLNLVFASGDLPDFINAPYWGGIDTCTQILKKAATEGQLLDLDEYLLKATSPDLINVYKEGLAKDFLATDLEGPEFKGKHYIIPFQKPRSEQDVTNWAYGAYARKDILDALKVAPSDIKSSDDVYQLLKKIKAGNFKDTTGKAIIPAGCWSGGWAYECIANSFIPRGTAQEYVNVDGQYVLDVFTPYAEKQILFMRKLVSEGLFDVEGYRQTEPRAQEKMALAKIAVVGANADKMYSWYNEHLKKDHPEMEYVPIGPIGDGNGTAAMPGTINQKGRSGTPCIVITKACKDPAAVIRFLDYINSEEGVRLTNYGVEGVHYDLVDGKPVAKADFLTKYNSNKQQTMRETGIRTVYNITLMDVTRS